MSPDVQPLDPPGHLLATAQRVVPGWLRTVTERAAHAGGVDPASLAGLDEVIERGAAELLSQLADVLAADVDAQRTNPLALFRGAVAEPTRLLERHRVPTPDRSGFDTEAFPDDAYGLGPAAWADVHPDLHEAGITWGAWKAMTVLRRRRDEGLRP